MNAPEVRTDPTQTDLEHLGLLGIFHYIVGAMIVLFACIFIIHVVMGLVIVFDPEAFQGPNAKQTPPPAFVGYLFAAIGSLAVLTGWTVGGLVMYSGRCLRKQRRRMFSLVMAGIACAFMPFGTVLGILTILVLQRDSVRQLYEQRALSKNLQSPGSQG